jgi:O-methyltransferase involved in polyketide biosynthesis
VASTGVAVYLTHEAITATLRQIAALAPGSTLAMTFMLPLELIEPEEQPGRQATERFARQAGTPFVSFATGAEMVALAREAGFREARHVSAAALTERYFSGRADGLRPSSSEELLVATT